MSNELKNLLSLSQRCMLKIRQMVLKVLHILLSINSKKIGINFNIPGYEMSVFPFYPHSYGKRPTINFHLARHIL
jgi:hypothetical protein